MPDKVSPGDPAGKNPLRKARNINRVMDAANDFHSRRALGESTPPSLVSGQTDLVGVKNSTGANRVKGEVVQLGDKLLADVDQGYLWLDAALPGSDPAERFAILVQPIPDGSLVNNGGQVSGVCFALIDISDEDHTRATPANNDPILQSSATGPVEILYKPSGIGDAKHCIVKLGSSPGGSDGAAEVAIIGTATLTQTMLSTDTLSVSISGFTSDSPDPFSVDPDPLPTSVYNSMGMSAPNGATVRIYRFGSTGWEVFGVKWSDLTGFDAMKKQHKIHDNAEWKWADDPTEAASHNPAVVQVLGHDTSGNEKWYTVAELLAELTGHTSSNSQAIQHPAGGTPAWEDTEEC